MISAVLLQGAGATAPLFRRTLQEMLSGGRKPLPAENLGSGVRMSADASGRHGLLALGL